MKNIFKLFIIMLTGVLVASCSSSPAPVEQSTESNLKSTSVTTTNMRNLPSQKDLFSEFSGAIIKTSLGDIKVKFYQESPLTVNNFMNLSKEGFYNDTKFHRVIKDFMIQGGDPLTKDDSKSELWGTGDPGYKFNDEFNEHLLVRGNLAMANSGPNSNGSQFFIVTAESTPWLDGKHVNFGEVVEGMDIVSKIEKVSTGLSDRPLQPISIKGVELIK